MPKQKTKLRLSKEVQTIADEELKRTLLQAAAAVDMSIEELTSTMVNAGVLSLPETDAEAVTQRFSLRDLGNMLWGKLQARPPSQRALWFGQLIDKQQAALIVVLKEQGFGSHVIAHDLGLSLNKVNKTWWKHCNDLGSQVIGLRLSVIAGQAQAMAEQTINMAREAGDYKAMWAHHKQLNELYQKMGIIEAAAQRIEVTHKMDDAQRLEIEELVRLERKQEKRFEEIKRIEASVSDELPAGINEDYD